MKHPIAVSILLGMAVGVVLLSCLGVVTMRGVFARTHYLGPASIVGPMLVMVAVLLEQPLMQGGVKAILIAGILVIENPLIAHLAGRMGRSRRPKAENRDPNSESRINDQ